jgi:hypothetical protein
MKSSTALPSPSFRVIASLAALGALLMLVVAISTAAIVFLAGYVDPGHLYFSWRRQTPFLVWKVTGPHLLTVAFAWAILTGMFFAIGAGIRHQRLRAVVGMTALLAGAMVALGLVLFAEALSGLWPRTSGPDPILTFLLLGYSFVAPWGLGRVARRLVTDDPR